MNIQKYSYHIRYNKRLRNKIIEIPTKMKEIIGAPDGRLSLLGLRGVIGAHDRLSFDDHLSFDDRLSYYIPFSISSFFFLYYLKKQWDGKKW